MPYRIRAPFFHPHMSLFFYTPVLAALTRLRAVAQVQAPQAKAEIRDFDPSRLVNRFIPMKVVVNFELVSKFKTKKGNWVLYPPKAFAAPPKLAFLVNPSILEVVDKTEIYQSKERIRPEWFETFHGEVETSPSGRKYVIPAYIARIKPGVYNVRVNTVRGLVEILPLREPPRIVKYKLIVARLAEKEAIRTAAMTKHEFNVKPVYETYNVSRSGAHWIRYAVFIVPVDFRVRIRKLSISNRGVHREYVIDVETGETLPRYEELEVIRDWEWGRAIRVRDNWTSEEFIMLELEYHESAKTCARTEHEIDGDVVLIADEGRGEGRTHWKEYYRVRRLPVKVTTFRMTNNCNKRVTEVVIQ